jgi:glycosyltransferase involved in cell wall biosynthesis
VVDDGSSDGTAKIAARAGAAVVSHTTSRGYDAALESGFAAAVRGGFTHAVTFDGDGQHSVDDLPVVAGLLTDGWDVVVGVRPHPARVSESLFSLYTRSRYRVRDPLCGLKGYSLRLYVELGHFDSYRSIGTELLLYALRSGRRVTEVPIAVARREGRSEFGGGLKGNWRILRALILGLIASRA